MTSGGSGGDSDQSPRRAVFSGTSSPANQTYVAVAAWALCVTLLATGSLHFSSPDAFASIVPESLGNPLFWVYASGAVELVCAGLLALRRTRRAAGWVCLVLFVGVFPANIKMALDSLDGSGNVLASWLRLPLQIPLLLVALYIARGSGRTCASAGDKAG